MRFEWDPAKGEVNRRKHRVSFEEATQLLASDADYLEIYDEEHSDEEDRFIGVGRTSRGVLIVVYTELEGDILRIVSARMATKKERHRFEQFEREQNEKRDS